MAIHRAISPFIFRRSERFSAAIHFSRLATGRLFEGTAAQLWESLTTLRKLPDETLVYCGHEYTEANAKFALAVDKNNPTLQARASEAADQRLQRQADLAGARLGRGETRQSVFTRRRAGLSASARQKRFSGSRRRSGCHLRHATSGERQV